MLNFELVHFSVIETVPVQQIMDIMQGCLYEAFNKI